MEEQQPYYPNGKMEAPSPLGRFLPPVADGPARSFLAELHLPGAWVLDPFGASPRLVVEMARSGQRVLVSAGNPVSRFLLDLTAHPPKQADLQAALADLAAARKEDERLETHLQSMYLTRCTHCERDLPAETFIWDSKTGALTSRIYNCPCGNGGEQPVTPEDVQRAVAWGRTLSMHRSRALERVAAYNDPDRPFAEEAIQIYPPRAVYALGILINKLDSISTSDERRRCMTALVLWAADFSNALWPHLTERPRPKQLTFPSVYREHNVWLALEAGVKAWGSSDAAPVPLVLWPAEPPEAGGICLFEGPLRELVPQLEGISLKAVVGAIPRPNQAFWTLSALWSGWLWGREAVAPFKSVLRRRRYDWQWHADALRALFGNLSASVSVQTPFFALLAEPEPSFLTAVVLAAQTAGLELTGLALRGEQEPLQLHWRKAEKALPKLDVDVNFVRKALREYLEKRGENMRYLHIHAAALMALAEKGMLRWSDDALALMDKAILDALLFDTFVDVEKRSNPESGLWGLRKWNEQTTLKGI